MKKILSTMCVIGALFASLAFMSCSDPVSGTIASGDTILVNLQGVDLHAKAYPGVNFITFTPEAGCTKYELFRDGKLLNTFDSTTEKFEGFYADFDGLVDGEEYTYTVNSVGTVSRDIATYSAKSKSKTIKADVPAAGTSVLYLEDEKHQEDPEKACLKADDITVTKDPNSNYYMVELDEVEEYLQYYVYTTVANEIDAVGYPSNMVLADSNGYAEILPMNGENTISVFVAYPYSVAPIFDDQGNIDSATYGNGTTRKYTYAMVDATDKVTIASPDTDPATDNLTTTYTNAGATAKVMWTPAVFSATNTIAATTDYTVYRYASYAFTPLTATVESKDNTGETYYYIEDTTMDNTVENTYFVVLSDGTTYGASVPLSLGVYEDTLGTLASVTPTVNLKDLDGDLAYDATVIDVTIDSDTTLSLSYADYGTEKDTTLTDAENAVTYTGDFTPITLPTADTHVSGSTTYNITESIAFEAGHHYIFRTIVSEAGYEAAYGYKIVDVDDLSVSFGGSFDAVVYDDNSVGLTVTDDEDSANYTYTAFVQTVDTTAGVITSDFESLGPVTMVQNADDSYTGVLTDTAKDDGVYTYRIVKSYADSAYTASKDDTVTITTASVLSGFSIVVPTTRDTATTGTVVVTYNTASSTGYDFTLYSAEYDELGNTLITNYTASTLAPAAVDGASTSTKTYSLTGLVSGHPYSFFVKATKDGQDDEFTSSEDMSD